MRALITCTDPCRDYARRCAETFHRFLPASFSGRFVFQNIFRAHSIPRLFGRMVLILFLAFPLLLFHNEIIAGGGVGMLKIQRTSLFKGVGMQVMHQVWKWPIFISAGKFFLLSNPQRLGSEF